MNLTTQDPELKDYIAEAQPIVFEVYDHPTRSHHSTRMYVSWIVDEFSGSARYERSFGVTRKGSFVLTIEQPGGGVSLSTWSSMTLGEVLDQLHDDELIREVRDALGDTVDLDI